MKTSIYKNKVFYSLLSIILIFILYGLLAQKRQDSQIFPSISSILMQIRNTFYDKKTMTSFGFSFLRVVITLGISFILSMLITVLYYYFPPIIGLFKPLIVIAKCAPLVTIILYLFILLGSKISPYVIVCLVTTPIMVEGCINSIDSVPNAIKDEVAITSGPKYYMFWHIYLPLIKKDIVTIFLQTIGLSFKVLVMAEYVCQTPNSIGVIINDCSSLLQTDLVLAIVIELIIIILIIESIAKFIQKKWIYN